MMTKNLKNKVLLSVFAGAMVFSCAASAAEIEIDGTGLAGSPDDSSWTDSKGLVKYNIALFEGADEGYRLENAKDKLVLKNFNNQDLAAYNVSGEYAMLKSAVKNGILSEGAIYESILSIKRAGADIIITYFAKDLAKTIRDNK